MDSISAVASLALDTAVSGSKSLKAPTPGGKSFQHTLEQVKSAPALPSEKRVDTYEKLIQFREAILSGKTFAPQQLISYQILASELGIKVEMISKVAEGAMSAARKLQSNQ